jgi:NTE family protein
VLSGGGARGAYQAGVLQGLLDIGVLGEGPLGFDVIVGSSAGSLNAALLAVFADDAREAVREIVDIWKTVEAKDVFRTDMRSLGGIGVRWAWDLSFGGALRRVQPKSLLDTSPLRELLKRISPRRIAANIKSGELYALAVAATDLYTSNGHLFIQGHRDIKTWERSRWHIEKTRIRIDHLMASSAIPIFFPPIEIKGRYFGDGCIRNTTDWWRSESRGRGPTSLPRHRSSDRRALRRSPESCSMP